MGTERMFIYYREVCSRRPSIVKCPRHSTVGIMKSCLKGTQEIRLLTDDVRRVYGVKNGRVLWALHEIASNAMSKYNTIRNQESTCNV